VIYDGVPMSIAASIDSRLEYLTGLRRQFHQIPELGYQEIETAKLIRQELDRLGIAHVDGVKGAPTATVAWIGDPTKPCVALRADIDALPIVEQTGLPYASRHDGVMHACGHDGHTTILLGVASVLKSIEAELDVCVKLLWQPAEEGGAGAEVMCNAGVLDGRIGPKVQAIFGLHGWPGIPLGVVSTRPGPLMAATDYFEATFTSHGGHAAFPHLSPDPIATAATAVLDLQQVVSRETDPTEPAVVSVTRINAGTADNIIPPACTISGTVRTLSGAMRTRAHDAIQRRCEGIASANRCGLEFQWEDGYPPVINDPQMADYLSRVAQDVFGPGQFLPAARPVMGGEDFAYYLEHVPGCFCMIGVEPPGAKDYPGLHSDRYDFNDAALPVGIRLLSELAVRYGR